MGKRLKLLGLAVLLLFLAAAALIVAGLREPLWFTARVSGLFTVDWAPRSIAYREAWIPVAPGERLHGWLLERSEPAPTILFLHGAGGNITGRVGTLKWMHEELQANVLIFDYRGYGQSNGECNEENLLADARAARAWLANELAIEEQQVILFGHSLGSMVATHIAAQDGARGLMITAAPMSVADVIDRVMGLGWLVDWRLNNQEALADYEGPLLKMVGEHDPGVAVENARELFELANEPKSFVVIPGMGHDGLSRSPEYRAAINRFVANL